MKIPKGGLHNINQSSQANINDSWNVLATDENNAVLIAVDKCGTKKTVGDTSNYTLLDASNLTFNNIFSWNETLDTPIEINRNDLLELINNKNLNKGNIYKIIDAENWSVYKHTTKAVYLKAISNSELSTEGYGEFLIPKYDTTKSTFGIWKGDLLRIGAINSATYSIGDKVIWGNLVWKNISGDVGSNYLYLEDADSDLYLPNWLNSEDWILVENNNESDYNEFIHEIGYDIINDIIIKRKDSNNNYYEASFDTLKEINPYYLELIVNYLPYVAHINLFQWEFPQLFISPINYVCRNNIIINSLVENANQVGDFSSNIIKDSYIAKNIIYKSKFKDNEITQNSSISNNNFVECSGFYSNNVKNNSSTYSNFFKNKGGIVSNNLLNNSKIFNNKYDILIEDNNIFNYSIIASNSSLNLNFENLNAKISKNILHLNSYIVGNNFIEEGITIDNNIKGIYDNNIYRNSFISSNIIKNGSRIFGNDVRNFSNITQNTLDRESNIYKNQVIQDSKINNNLLTGHSRIYGNQLDRISEITNCKLRISPASSYSTTMKNNRLFAGKIQNVDFGDIVNPVGTNHYDPNFGGNALSECIIENVSIIKDLTFPNHGGVGIQFVKMNGASEFKNITVNDSIRSVEFINTVFDENSDYSKIIQGADYGGRGFTKYYLDNVLLQDRFDEKQDVLTEDNVGAFMDLELPTKLTPTSGDTVLGRDSVTGKAVTINVNAQMLITMLNSASPSELSTIKSILGIV